MISSPCRVNSCLQPLRRLSAWFATGVRTVQDTPPDANSPRVLSVALVGFPNAGKSELCNKLIGIKISGVSSKRNTTLEPRLGAFTSGPCQVILYDTPGLVSKPAAANPIDRLRSAWHVAAAADLILYIVDADKQFKQRDHALLHMAQQLSSGPKGELSLPFPWPKPPLVLLLNKKDKLEKDLAPAVLKQLETHFKQAAQFVKVFSISALEGQGIGNVRQYLLRKTKPGNWLLPPGQCHVETPGKLAVELVREKLLRRLHKELPYKLGVVLLSERQVWNRRSRTQHARVGEGTSMGDSSERVQVVGEHAADGAGAPLDPAEHQQADAAAVKGVPSSASQTPLTPGEFRDGEGPQPVHEAQGLHREQAPTAAAVWQVHVEVLAENPRVRSIVIGPKGSIIQAYVTEPTQRELTDIFKQPVKLAVSVRVAP